MTQRVIEEPAYLLRLMVALCHVLVWSPLFFHSSEIPFSEVPLFFQSFEYSRYLMAPEPMKSVESLAKTFNSPMPSPIMWYQNSTYAPAETLPVMALKTAWSPFLWRLCPLSTNRDRMLDASM